MINYIDDNNKSEFEHVKFISYKGQYPNLCRGVLTLEIDGEEVKFGHDYFHLFESWERDAEGKLIADGNYNSFWVTGGSCEYENDGIGCYTTHSEWEINEIDIPEKYRKYIKEIDSLFNENVAYGCCGGCF